MAWLVLMVLGPVLAGLVIALAWWLVRGRRTGLPDGSNRVVPVLAGLVPVLGVAAERLLGMPLFLPFEVPAEVMGWYMDYNFTIPLLLGILGLALLAFPAHPRGGRGVAALSPRTPTSFGRRSWFAAPAVVAALIVLVTVVAGSASQPDLSTGRHTVYWVEVGGQYAMGASIYGWFYSIPCLVLLGVLLTVAYLDLFLISRPALDRDHGRDVHTRTVRTRNVLAITTGALLVHLGSILSSLAGTASIRGQFSVEGGTVTSWTTFAALEPVFLITGGIAVASGVALWAAVPLSAVPARQQARTRVAA